MGESLKKEWQVARETRVGEEEMRLTFSRGGGPGGQHVNKVATRVEVLFDVGASRSLSRAQKDRLRTVMGKRMSADGVLRVVAGDSRSQAKNRDSAIRRLVEILRRALRPVKPRVPTRPTKGSRMRRREEKTRRSLAKKRRRIGANERN